MLTRDFLAPGRLWLLAAVAVIAAGYAAASIRRRRAALRFTQLDLLDTVAPKRPGWRRHVVAGLQLAALAAAIVAVAQPVQRETFVSSTQGRIMVLFDVSISMAAEDVDPDRFTAAKEQARAFVDEAHEDVELGLISFSEFVSVEVPPTVDRGLMHRAIDSLQLDFGTSIGDALALGTRVLTSAADGQDDIDGDDDRGSNEGDSPGVIVLLTDGETTTGDLSTDQGGEVAADAGIPVFTIAFGTLDGFIDDPQFPGRTVPVPYVPDALDNVAEMTGGAAFEATTGEELAQAYDQIDELLGETLGDEDEVVREQTWKWAATAVAMLAAAWLLSLWLLRGIL